MMSDEEDAILSRESQRKGDDQGSTSTVKSGKIVFKYQTKDQVLCWSQGILYQGTILRTEVDSAQPFYYIHYKGYNSKWDESVSEDRLMDITEENLQLAEMQIENAEKMPKSRKKGRPGEGHHESVGKRRNRQSVSSSSQEEMPTEEDASPMIPIPELLQEVLLKERKIMLSSKEPISPSKEQMSIEKLLQNFLADSFEPSPPSDERDKENSPEQAAVVAPSNLFREEVCKGLVDCVNRFLYLRLLYSVEIDEYRRLCLQLTKDRKDAGAAEVKSLTEEELLNLNGAIDLTPHYFPVHLLRLFVHLPQLLDALDPLTKVDNHEENIYSCFADLLQYMVEHRDELFGSILSKDVSENHHLMVNIVAVEDDVDDEADDDEDGVDDEGDTEPEDEEEGEDDGANKESASAAEDDEDEDEGDEGDDEFDESDEEEEKRNLSSNDSNSPLPSPLWAQTLSETPTHSTSSSANSTPQRASSSHKSASTPTLSSPPPSPSVAPPYSPMYHKSGQMKSK